MNNLSPDTVEDLANMLSELLHDWLDDKARCPFPNLHSLPSGGLLWCSLLCSSAWS